MKSDKASDPRKVLTDLSALEEAFSGVRRLGEPPRKGLLPAAAVAAPAGRAPIAPSAPAPTAPAPVAAPPRPIVDDATLLREAMHGVRRLDGANPRPPARTAAATPPAAPQRSTPPTPPAPPAPPVVNPLREVVDTLSTQLDVARARITELEAALAAAGAARAEAEASVAARPLSPTTPAEHVGPPPSLREIATERGLIGDDELVVALRAVFDARRAAAMFDELVAKDGAGLEQFFAERLVLAAEGEAVPPGRVAVVVPAERSELREDSPIRKALSLFSTACLIHGKLRVVFVGGSPAYRRQLREGLDRRLDVRFVEGDQRRIPRTDGADLVIVWGGTELDHTVSAHFPDAIVIQHRGIIRMLELAAARIAG
ncbi:hypothetical protein LBMAG42_42800 [Deltaproteobacteria bacterium]|nr:hypothetical protein LBMAG42_42800 [Deltaproteobacteria bacterium]